MSDFHNFDQRKKFVALNIYKAILDNYEPIPDAFIEHKDDILSFLETAWVDGANWRYTQFTREKKDI